MGCLDTELKRVKALSPESLEDLTRMNALGFYEKNGDPNPLRNWVEGKKLTAFTIIDRYLQDCRCHNTCLPLPDYFFEYFSEIDVNDIKELKAYFVWESKGRNVNNTSKETVENYYDACHTLMNFCDQLANKHRECAYNDILTLIDRRCGSDRRKLPDRRKKEEKIRTERRALSDQRTNPERRVFDHRGPAAAYF